MGYLAPPPMPAPVVVTKDVGGFVADYQAQTELYRASDREVRLHECRSACTLALSLPNVCVYPDSILKFHLAYDPRNHQTDANVSQQLFESYPAAVRARLGVLTREYKVLRGSELIALGIRNCNEGRVMVASASERKRPPTRPLAHARPAEQGSFFADLMQNISSVFDGSSAPTDEARDRIAVARAGAARKPMESESTPVEPPLPPARPMEIVSLTGAAPQQEAGDAPPAQNPQAIGAQASDAEASDAQNSNAPSPPNPAIESAHPHIYNLASIALPKIITGAQRILSPRFSAYAPLDR